MKTIIAGSRFEHKDKDSSYTEKYWEASSYLEQVISELQRLYALKITEVVSGTAKGADMLGEVWATYYGVPIKRFPADWNRLGRHAGFVRNTLMAEYADVCIALWDGSSPGTRQMIDEAKRCGLLLAVADMSCRNVTVFKRRVNLLE